MNGATATDPTGCVTITLSDSSRVDAIRLSSRWREKLGTERLGGAVAEAVLAARAELADSSPARAAPSPEPTAASAYQVAELCRQALIGATHQVERDRKASRVGYTGSDVRHHVTATLTLDGTPTAIGLDPKWLETVSTERLIETIREALDVAYDAAETARRELAGTASPAADQLSRLMRAEGGT